MSWLGPNRGGTSWADEPAKPETTAAQPSVLPPSAAQPAAPANDGESLQSQLKAAAGKLESQQAFLLRYKFQPGDEVRWRVVQLVTVDTKIRGSSQIAKTRSVSTKVWKVRSVDEAGNITFTHQVDDADMWQSNSGAPEVHYNSRAHATPPREYALVANSVGKPLANVTLAPSGRVVKRDSLQPHFSPTTAELAIPFPEQPIRVGTKWNLPDEVRVRLDEGRVQRVQIRQVFTLEKVETGIATIGVRTEVITPINEPKVQAQLVQKLLNGRVKFDIDAGRLHSKQVDLDETVIGFSGADSVMQYLARFTEEQVTAEAAEKSAVSLAEAARAPKSSTPAAKPTIVRGPVAVADAKSATKGSKEPRGAVKPVTGLSQ